MRKRWPTPEEINRRQAAEDAAARTFNDVADLICDCGEPGWCCRCEEMAAEIGYWPDGEAYESEG